MDEITVKLRLIKNEELVDGTKVFFDNNNKIKKLSKNLDRVTVSITKEEYNNYTILGSPIFMFNNYSSHHHSWLEEGRLYIIEIIIEYKDQQYLTLYNCNDILKSQGKEEIELSINNLEKDMEGLDEDVVAVALGDDEVIVKKESLRALSQLLLDYRNKIMKKDMDLEYIEYQLTLEIKALKDVIKNLKSMNKGLMERNNFIEHNKMLERLGLDMIE